MKKIRYMIREVYNIGKPDNPVWHDEFYEKIVDYSESNMEIAKAEAFGEISPPFDDAQPDVVSVQEDVDNMLIDHELRLTMIELYM